jgi:hypothetical protein
MHLNENVNRSRLFATCRIIKKYGRLIISIRGTNEENKRENGKLYESINIESFKQFFEKIAVKFCFMKMKLNKLAA